MSRGRIGEHVGAVRGQQGRARRAGPVGLLVLGLLLVLGFDAAWSQDVPEERPITMEEAVRVALQRNRDVQAARYALEEAEDQVSEAWGGVLPKVDLTAGYTRNVSPDISFLPARIFDPQAGEDEFIRVQFGADNLWTSQVYVEQALFQPQVFVAVGAAGRFRSLQDEALRGRQQEVVTRVRVAYLDLLLSQERLRLTENSLERVRSSLEETQALNRAGLASDYDVLRLEVEVANLETALRRALSAAASARRDLAVELSVDPEAALEVAGNLATLDPDHPEANTLENRALLDFGGAEPLQHVEARVQLLRQARERRSDLRQADLNRDLRRTQLRLEQADYLPRVSLFGTYNVNAQQSGAPVFFGESGQRAYGRRIGINVTIPIFTGMQREARVGQRRAALRQAEVEAELAAQRADNEIVDLMETLEETRERTRVQRRAVELAERGYEIASAQYREGIGSQLELTDAEVALRESEFNYAEAVYDYLTARASFDEAVGTVPGVDHLLVRR